MSDHTVVVVAGFNGGNLVTLDVPGEGVYWMILNPQELREDEFDQLVMIAIGHGSPIHELVPEAAEAFQDGLPDRVMLGCV